MARSEDIQAMLADFGVAVVGSFGTTRGLFDQVTKAEDLDGDAQVLAGLPSVLVERAKVSGVKVDASITVDGTAYTVRDRAAHSDGALERLFLRKVS